MAARSFCSLPNFTQRNPNNHPSRSIKLPHFFNLQNHIHRDDFSLKAWTESLPSSPNADYLEREFGGHGASFEAMGDDCVIKMGLENGSSANMVLPSGLITSYKPKMWHGGRVEVLHTLVSEDQNGEAVVHGGISMDFECVGDGGFAWSPTNWDLLDVRGSSNKFIQVELISTSPNGKMKANCMVTLREDQLSSDLTVINSTPLFIQLQGRILTHLTTSTPDATYAVGLQGSNYCYKQAKATEFSIIPPKDSEKTESFFRSLAQKGFDGLFSGWGTKKHRDEEEEEGEEKEECSDYVQMNDKLSRIYTSAPVEFTVIDRGRRNSVVIQKNGFEEVYMFSPGSDHNWYGKYAFVCVGPCALLKPVVLVPQGIWKGGQYFKTQAPFGAAAPLRCGRGTREAEECGRLGHRGQAPLRRRASRMVGGNRSFPASIPLPRLRVSVSMPSFARGGGKRKPKQMKPQCSVSISWIASFWKAITTK